MAAGAAPRPRGLINPGPGYGSGFSAAAPARAAALERCAAPREKLRAAGLETLLSKPLCCGFGVFFALSPLGRRCVFSLSSAVPGSLIEMLF